LAATAGGGIMLGNGAGTIAFGAAPPSASAAIGNANKAK